jgi:hypothetical protein
MSEGRTCTPAYRKCGQALIASSAGGIPYRGTRKFPGSLIITSNRAFEEWGEIFANDLLASATLDRLTHPAHTLVIRGDSFRQRSRRKDTPLRQSSPKQQL